MSRSFVAVYFLAACCVMLLAAVQPGTSGKVAVFAAPWGETASNIIAHAGGQIVSTDRSGWIAISVAEDKGLVGRLYASGAFFVASSIVAQACAKL